MSKNKIEAKNMDIEKFDLENIVKWISRTLAALIFIFVGGYTYLDYKGYVYSDGFDLVGRLGARGGEIREISLMPIKEANAADEAKPEPKPEVKEAKENKVEKSAPSAMKITAEERKEILKEKVLGNEKAEVALLDFSSLDCPACGKFHKDVLPEIKKNYVDNGKVKLIIKDFPLHSLSMGALVMARCMPEARFYSFMDILFTHQKDWVLAENPKQFLFNYARLGGGSVERLEACLQDRRIMDSIQEKVEASAKEYGINATPTLVIKKGDKVTGMLVGAKKYEEYAAEIDAALK